jgi:hypothetical protein
MLDALSIIVRTLLLDNGEFTGVEIVKGRSGYRKNLNNAIIVDYLTSTPLSIIENFDGVNEKMEHYSLNRYRATLTFFGDSADALASKWRAICQSHNSVELQKLGKIRIGSPVSFKNLRTLFGKRHEDVVEVEFDVDFNDKYVDLIPTLSIEHPQIEVITED